MELIFVVVLALSAYLLLTRRKGPRQRPVVLDYRIPTRPVRERRVASPDGRRAAIFGEYTEIRMGSPQFATMRVEGGVADTANRSFGKTVAFSSDSRFLAVERFAGIRENGSPRTHAVVFDLETGTETMVHDQNPGFIEDVTWNPDGSLTIRTWSHLAGKATFVKDWRG